MEAHAVFQDVLRRIENSNLNYSLSKTPFSASISLKCSLVKRYEDISQVVDFSVSQVDDFSVTANMVKNNFEVFNEVKRLETENVELQKELEQLKAVHDKDQKRLLKETVHLQNLYELEQEKTSNLADNVKTKEEVCQKMKMKVEAIDADIIELKKSAKDTNKIIENKQNELGKNKRELKDVEENLAMTLAELENIKLARVREPKVYNCDICDLSAESLSQLKLHNRHNHCQNEATQCEENSNFLKYNCFYCDESFISSDELAAHPTNCHNN